MPVAAPSEEFRNQSHTPEPSANTIQVYDLRHSVSSHTYAIAAHSNPGCLKLSGNWSASSQKHSSSISLPVSKCPSGTRNRAARIHAYQYCMKDYACMCRRGIVTIIQSYPRSTCTDVLPSVLSSGIRNPLSDNLFVCLYARAKDVCTLMMASA
jgi:hypothetical protein